MAGKTSSWKAEGGVQDWQLGLLLASSGPEQMPVSAVPARQVEASVQLEHTTSPEDVEFSATY